MKNKISYFFTACLCMLLSGGCSSGKEDIPEQPSQPQPEADRITSNSSTIYAEASEGTSTYTFNTNKTWSVTSDQEWCTLSPTEGGAGSITLTITHSANPDEKERTAVITIKAGTATATATVKQAAKEADKITLKNSTYEMDTDGTGINLEFTTNASWSATSDQEWCKISATEGEKGSQKLTVTGDENTTPEDRNALITLIAGKATQTVTITQYRKEIIEPEKTVYEMAYMGGKIIVNVKSNTDYTAKADVSWISITPKDKEKLEIDIQKNPTKEKRKATVLLNGKYTSTSFIIQQDLEKIDESGIEGMPNENW